MKVICEPSRGLGINHIYQDRDLSLHEKTNLHDLRCSIHEILLWQPQWTNTEGKFRWWVHCNYCNYKEVIKLECTYINILKRQKVNMWKQNTVISYNKEIWLIPFLEKYCNSYTYNDKKLKFDVKSFVETLVPLGNDYWTISPNQREKMCVEGFIGTPSMRNRFGDSRLLSYE